MADVLYDMNIAENEIADNYAIFSNNKERREELLNSVFKKHKITQQEFDTSLVWYNAHKEVYFKICDQVNKRYTAEMELLDKKIEAENKLIAERNRINIFEGERSIFLRTATLLQNTVHFKVDSIEWSFGDNLEVSFDVLGLNKGVEPEVLCYVFCEDTIITQKEKILANGSFLKLMPPGMNKIRSFSASVHLPDTITNANILINNFGIFQRKNQGNNLITESSQPILKR